MLILKGHFAGFDFCGFLDLSMVSFRECDTLDILFNGKCILTVSNNLLLHDKQEKEVRMSTVSAGSLAAPIAMIFSFNEPLVLQALQGLTLEELWRSPTDGTTRCSGWPVML